MGRGARAGLVVAVVASVVAVVTVNTRSDSTCRESYQTDVTVKDDYGKAIVRAELATSDVQRQKGLSGRACIPNNTALLFIFNDAAYHGIWMKDMNFPIDVVWLDEAKIVVNIEKRMNPSSYPKVYSPKVASLYILELDEGMVDELGIKYGSKLSW